MKQKNTYKIFNNTKQYDFFKVFALVKRKYFKLRRIKAIYSKKIGEFKTKSRPRTKKGKYKKKIRMNVHMLFMKVDN